MLWLLLGATGCPKQDATATVQCGSLEKFRGDVGNFNSANWALGSLVVIDTEKRTGSFLDAISPADTDTTSSPPIGREESHFASEFELEVSANVPAAVAANIKTAINSQTTVLATNLRRVSIKDAASVLNRSASAAQAIKEVYANAGPNIVVLFISSIVYADSTSIELASSTKASAGVSTLSYGDYKVAVAYKCSGSVNRTASGTPFGAYFKTTVIRYDAAKQLLVADFGTTIDLSNYNFVNALSAH